MEVVITADTIIKAAAVFTALGVICGGIVKLVQFFERQKAQDKAIAEIRAEHESELAAIRHEQTLICYGVLACLKGLKEQGCNGPVTKALDKLEKHLNQTAHGDLMEDN